MVISTVTITASNKFLRYLLFVQAVYDQKIVYSLLIIRSEGPWASGPGPVGPWDGAHGTGTMGPGPWPMRPGPWDHGTGTMGPVPWDTPKYIKYTPRYITIYPS